MNISNNSMYKLFQIVNSVQGMAPLKY